MQLRAVLGLAALTLAIGLGWPAYGQPAALVATDPVIIEPTRQTQPVIGRLVARDNATIAARVAGAVSDVRVNVGDHVEEGDVLVVLDLERLEAEVSLVEAEVGEIEARAAAARAGEALAQQDLDRLEGLRESAAFSQGRYDDAVQEMLRMQSLAAEAEARLRRGLVAYDLARLDLDYGTIRAPFAGTISQRHTSLGEYLTIGAPVVALINDSDLEIEVAVPFDRLGGLEPGVEIAVRLAERGGDDADMRTAAVRAIVPVEDPLTRTRRVRMTPSFNEEEAGLAVNQSVTAMIPTGAERDVLTVHKDAVVNGPGGSMVFVVVDGTAQPRPITIGVAVGQRFEVTSGLAEGDEVVIRGNERLAPGQAVQTGNGPPASG
ncbi:MAG: efflux RND transporter periplasmic adaptor subunit [Pseudomonadota bacterium]